MGEFEGDVGVRVWRHATWEHGTAHGDTAGPGHGNLLVLPVVKLYGKGRRALLLALVISASVMLVHRLASSSSVEAPISPSFSPPIPHFMSDARSICSRADFLFGVRMALIGSRSARYFSPTCSPRARMSAFMDPSPPSPSTPPSSPAGFRSTFDRLP